MFHFPLGDGRELRLFEEADAAPLFAMTDRNRSYLREWMPWVDGTRTPEDSAAFIRHTMEQFAAGNGFQTGIWDGGELAGVIGFHYFDRANRQTEIGYWLDAGHQGRGIMTRACRALVDHAVYDQDLNRVQIRCATANTRSRAIPERLGFTQEGILREAEWLYDHYVDHVLYAMLAADWRARAQEHC